jgi:hypothetical protein
MENGILFELLDIRTRIFISEQSFRIEHDQRFPEIPPHLSAERQEVIGRGGTLNHLHVGLSDLLLDLLFFQDQSRVVLTELQETLHTPGRVFRPLAVHSVR